MEDYILREIDRIGEMLMKVAQKMGLFLDQVPDYSISEVKEEWEESGFPFALEEVLEHEFPVPFLVQEKGFSDHALELFVEILFRSDLDEAKKKSLLKDALSYLDGKGYYSFKLHSFC